MKNQQHDVWFLYSIGKQVLRDDTSFSNHGQHLRKKIRLKSFVFLLLLTRSLLFILGQVLMLHALTMSLFPMVRAVKLCWRLLLQKQQANIPDVFWVGWIRLCVVAWSRIFKPSPFLSSGSKKWFRLRTRPFWILTFGNRWRIDSQCADVSLAQALAGCKSHLHYIIYIPVCISCHDDIFN